MFLFYHGFRGWITVEWWCYLLAEKEGKLYCLIQCPFVRYIFSFQNGNWLCFNNSIVLAHLTGWQENSILVVHAMHQWWHHLAHPWATPKVMHGDQLYWTWLFLQCSMLQWIEVSLFCLESCCFDDIIWRCETLVLFVHCFLYFHCIVGRNCSCLFPLFKINCSISQNVP
jgi:hypothetical protein